MIESILLCLLKVVLFVLVVLPAWGLILYIYIPPFASFVDGWIDEIKRLIHKNK